VGICVRDLDAALRFWVDGVGFEKSAAFDVGAEYGPLMEVENPKLRSQFVERDGIRLELLHFAEPGALATGERRPVNQVGLTHVCLQVDDVDAVAERLVQHGGAIVEGTRTVVPMGSSESRFVYLTDPDGTRVELMALGVRS
jgi:lactoylglutathione lyase